jgi:hypothetical protein
MAGVPDVGARIVGQRAELKVRVQSWMASVEASVAGDGPMASGVVGGGCGIEVPRVIMLPVFC